MRERERVRQRIENERERESQTGQWHLVWTVDLTPVI